LLTAAVKALQATRVSPPRLAIVLGSGFGGVLSGVRAEAGLPYAAIPGFAPAGVAGHPGKLVLGRLAGTPVCLLAGRAHFYEGHDLATVTFPIQVLARWGVKEVLLTNAAGGIHRRFRPGDFMLLTDHINFMGANPLRGTTYGGDAPFVDLSAVYDAGLAARLRAAARAAKLRLRRGVYLAVSGPSYETPAEIRAFARLGADAVGMSTVPEAIVARQCGLHVAGLSCITNLAAGRARQPISHTEVLAVAAQIRDRAARLLAEFARRPPDAQIGSPGNSCNHPSM
jgi:inosine/guanosine/xanthosine phosphorylase family protein